MIIKPFVSLPCSIDVDVYKTFMAKCSMQSRRRMSIRISRYNKKKNTCVELFSWYVFFFLANEHQEQSILMKVTGLIRCSKEAKHKITRS